MELKLKTLIVSVLIVLFSVYIVNIVNEVREILQDDKAPKKVRTVEEWAKNRHEFAMLDFIGLVERNPGYTAEEYTVESDDGYILKLHHISSSPSKAKNVRKPVVYMQHCLLCSSDIFVFAGSNLSLALQLADSGYDVWLGNVRGNTYSTAHVKHSQDAADFWDFSMDEIALHDVPRLIDFVLEKTNQTKLTYIGYSMGTTLGYMLLSSRPEYNNKMNLVINLAPEVYFSEPTLSVTFNLKTVIAIANLKNARKMMPRLISAQKYVYKYCANAYWNPCNIWLRSMASLDKIEPNLILQLFTYLPAGTSLNVVKHFHQLSGYDRKFRKFQKDEVTSARDPDEYDLSLVTAPVALYYGPSDALGRAEDVEYLRTKLKNVVASEKIADPRFNHFDFILHNNAKSLVYDNILKVMRKNL